MRGREMSVVFQDPMTSLNPVLTIGRQMRDIQYREASRTAEKDRRAAAMLGRVGLPDPEARLRGYPHELSGGMRQRVAIAMATLMHPKLLIADEPTTALDATLEVQIIALAAGNPGRDRLRDPLHLASSGRHRRALRPRRRHVCGRDGRGRPRRRHIRTSRHPYTHKLIECDPGRLKTRAETLPSIPGSLPDLTDPPAGCIFRDRCDLATELCARQRPPRRSVSPGRWSACHHAEKVTP